MKFRRSLPVLLLYSLVLLWGWSMTTATGTGTGPETRPVPLADGFETPVGKGGSGVYHRARGFTPNGHLGEDWNGAGGGDTDLGDPINSTAHGLVVYADNFRMGWGNVVIIRHAYLEDGQVQFVDSLYGHLLDIKVKQGQIVRRGEQIGTMGNNNGMYHAHLHFEMRKNLAIGMNRSAFARDFSNYYDPTRFIIAHRRIETGGQYAQTPINTFTAPVPGTAPQYAGPVTGGATTSASRPLTVPTKPLPQATTTNNPRGPFRVDRFSDLR